MMVDAARSHQKIMRSLEMIEWLSPVRTDDDRRSPLSITSTRVKNNVYAQRQILELRNQVCERLDTVEFEFTVGRLACKQENSIRTTTFSE